MRLLDEDDYESALATISKHLLVLFVSAPDCEPCRRMRPLVVKLAKSYQADGIAFANINKRLCPNICSDYGIDIVPSFVFIRNSKPFARIKGSCTEDRLRNYINQQANYVAGFGL